jgi:2-polyprenyl-3-methyl-5-hydroxy-6-metoxy-1,4-benzoquinol methylase
MTEWCLYDPADPPAFFTPEWHDGRDRAPHLEQAVHQERLRTAATLVARHIEQGARSVVDLGCGDGGLLSLIGPLAECWGYDLMPANIAAARQERHVEAWHKDFVNDSIRWADVAVCTEVLEHLEDPHKMVARIAGHARRVVASSPSEETADSHDEVHAWAWDPDGYRAMFESAGITVTDHIVTASWPHFQVLAGTVQ